MRKKSVILNTVLLICLSLLFTACGKSGGAAAEVVTFNITSSNLTVAIGESKTIATNIVSTEGKTIVWASTNSSVATVSSAGVVTGVAAGTSKITLSVDGNLSETTVTVTADPVVPVDPIVPVDPVDPIVPVDSDATYIYSTTGAGIGVNWSQWDTGTVQEVITTDVTYPKVIKLTSTGGWGNCIAFADLTAGLFTEKETLNFKIKASDYTEISIKLPEVEKKYQLSSGTILADGWVQMSIPLSDFSTAARASLQFAIFNNSQDATGKVMYLADITLTGTGTNPVDPVDPISDLTGPTVVAPSTAPSTASVLYSSSTANGSSFATINEYAQNWYGAIAYSLVDVAGENVLRYTSSGLGGECVALATNSFNVANKTKFHMDVFLTAGVKFFQLKFVDGAGRAKMVNLHTVPDYAGALIETGKWVTIDMTIASMDIPGGGGVIDWSDLRQTGILLTNAGAGDKTYIDNMYFY